VTVRAAKAGIITGNPPGSGADQRRNRAAAVHGVEQPVLSLNMNAPMANLPS